MKTSLLSLFAGTVFLAGAAGASAGELVTLAAAELDAVTAGQTAVAIGAAAVNVALADQRMATNPISNITQSATATNSGPVTATVPPSAAP